MKCSKCGSENISVQMITAVKEKRKKGIVYWIFMWWWEIFAWLFLTLPKLIIALFGKHTKVISKTYKTAVCQNCGYSWKI